MKKVYQRHDEDCLVASMATLFSMKYEDIPVFSKGIEWNDEKNKWLKKNGLASLTLEIEKLVPLISEDLKCLVYLKKADKKHSHCVVGKLWHSNSGTLNLELLHDPLKKSPYKLDDLYRVEIFFISLD